MKARIRGGGTIAVLLAASLALGLRPLPAAAETVVRTGNAVSVAVNQTVENDFYAAGGSVSSSGEVKGDFYAAAGSVTVNGPVGSDLTVVGGSVQLHAPVKDDVRIVAGDMVIAGEVGGDVFVIGGTLQVLSSAAIAGNVYFYGGEAAIDGKVAGAIHGRARSIAVNSEVGGLDVSAVTLELQDGARVRGDIAYSSMSELSRAPGAAVEGEIVRGAPAPKREEGSGAPLIFLAIWLFTSLAAFLLLRPAMAALAAAAKRDTLRAGLIGLAAALLSPVAGVVLVATVLGAWLGLLLILALLFLFVLSLILLPVTLGGYLVSFWRQERALDVVAVLAGMLAIAILGLIPVAGPLVILLALMVTLGAILLSLYRQIRHRL